MIDILKDYDSVATRKGDKSDSVSDAHNNAKSNRKLVAKPLRKFLAPPQLSSTKQDQYKVATLADKNFVQDGRNMKHADIGKLEKLKEYQEYLRNELTAAQCPPKGPDLKRIQIYSTFFERLIQDFTTHGELLAEIKKEYDMTLSSFQTREEELTFLRTKVQKLLSQNENRMMLKFEKKKCKELENKIAVVEKDNAR